MPDATEQASASDIIRACRQAPPAQLYCEGQEV